MFWWLSFMNAFLFFILNDVALKMLIFLLFRLLCLQTRFLLISRDRLIDSYSICLCILGYLGLIILLFGDLKLSVCPIRVYNILHLNLLGLNTLVMILIILLQQLHLVKVSHRFVLMVFFGYTHYFWLVRGVKKILLKLELLILIENILLISSLCWEVCNIHYWIYLSFWRKQYILIYLIAQLNVSIFNITLKWFF